MTHITYEELERAIERGRRRIAQWEAKLSEIPPNRDGRRSPGGRQIRLAIKEEQRLVRSGEKVLAELGKDVA